MQRPPMSTVGLQEGGGISRSAGQRNDAWPAYSHLRGRAGAGVWRLCFVCTAVGAADLAMVPLAIAILVVVDCRVVWSALRLH
jgi:hypothetical protein